MKHNFIFSVIILFFVTGVISIFSSCVSTQDQKTETTGLEEMRNFDEFLFEHSSSKLSSDQRFNRILDMHRRIAEYMEEVHFVTNDILQLKEEIVDTLEMCSVTENSNAYIVSSSIVEPNDVAYYEKSIYSCEYFLTDSEIAMGNAKKHLDYLKQIQRELERSLFWVQRECEVRGMADEYRYLMEQNLRSYEEKAVGQEEHFSRWLEDVEGFAMEYAVCMKQNQY